jgi:electron transfer flavoprotein beta subunit
VCLKQSVDVSQLKVDPATGRLVTAGVSRKVSDFDKNALEEAVRIREKIGCEVVTLTMNDEETKASIREALAIGADKGFVVQDEALTASDTWVTSNVLVKALEKIGEFDLILCGEASIDGFSAQVGPRVGEALKIPVVTYARKLTVVEKSVQVERVLDDRYETVEVTLPALVTVTKEINDPRIPSLMAIMKASKKEIVFWKLGDIGLSAEDVGENGSGIKVVDITVPQVGRKKIRIEGETAAEVAEKLVKELIQEGVIGK